MWIYKGKELGLEGIIGVPAEDLSDEDFAKYIAKQNAQFPDQMGSLERSGLYEHVPETSAKAEVERPSTRRSSSQPEQTTESEAPVQQEADSNEEAK